MARSPVAALRREEEFDDEAGYRDYDDEDEEEEGEGRFSGGTRSGGAMPKPPAGFVLDDQGRCIAAASKRIVTIVSCITFTFVLANSFILEMHYPNFILQICAD